LKLSEENRRILLVNIHNLIAEYANTTANDIQYKRTNQLINYPSNGGLTEEEKTEIEKLNGNEKLKSALRKVLASNAADVIFSLLNIIDGTADPDIDSANWGEIMLVDFSEENEATEMLHDEFFSTYWDWKEKKKMNWKLDLLDEDE
jgi:hypothetical protein